MFISLKPLHLMNRRAGYFHFQTHGFERRPRLLGFTISFSEENKSISSSLPVLLVHTSFSSKDLIVKCSAGGEGPFLLQPKQIQLHNTTNKSTSGKGCMLCIWSVKPVTVNCIWEQFLLMEDQNPLGQGLRVCQMKGGGIRKRVKGCYPPPVILLRKKKKDRAKKLALLALQEVPYMGGKQSSLQKTQMLVASREDGGGSRSDLWRKARVWANSDAEQQLQ